MTKRAPATGIYHALIAQIHGRIRRLGIPMWKCDDLSGLQDGYTAKLLHPDTPSGRQARWDTLQLLLDAIYPEGFVLTIRPVRGGDKSLLNRFSMEPNKTNEQRVRSTAMAMGRRGGLKSWEARKAKLTRSDKKVLAQKGAAARWRLKKKLTALKGGVS